MTLSKIAHSTKNSTTPMTHTIINSITIILKSIVLNPPAKIQNQAAILIKGVKNLSVLNYSLSLRHNPKRTAMNYDANPVHLLYNDEELKDRINMVMDSRDHTTGITFVNLCYQLMQMAFQENKVKKADDTIVTSEELAPEEQVRVSRILWELIWNHKVFLLFGRSELLGLSNGEDRFVKY